MQFNTATTNPYLVCKAARCVGFFPTMSSTADGRALGSFLTYHINLDDECEFYADVRDAYGMSVFEIDGPVTEIDTPESKQPYGSRARQALSQIAFGKDVTLKVKDTDQYGGTVARAFVGDADINAHLVSSGAAWVYRQYSKGRDLLALESAARGARVGLWALPQSERMPPWEWRRAVRK